ncbi:MAG: epoxyqueuosine reductase [Anaerofustis stercorihominis]|nr:epoxyqueuosine reductase [Anaerofustis stercorihominis]
MHNTEIAGKIYRAALSSGFDNCGIIPVNYLDGFKDRIRQRRKDIPSSTLFYKVIGYLQNTKKRFPWAKSFVICSYWYGKYRYPEELRGRYAKDFFLMPEDHPAKGYDHLAFEKWFSDNGIRYAGGDQFSHFSAGPLRYAAVMAGMGIIRKNNFFYTENGSYNLLVGYVIGEECELIHQHNLKPCPDSCDICRKSCRTKALKGAYTMDPFRCVSLWTTFGKGFVPPYLKKEMFEEWMCGCDNCQDACPYNKKHNWDEGESFSEIDAIAGELLPENIQNLTDEYILTHIIPKAGKHLGKRDVSTLRRNAKRAVRYRKDISSDEYNKT